MKVTFGLLYKYKTNKQEAEHNMWKLWQPVIELFKCCISKAGTAQYRIGRMFKMCEAGEPLSLASYPIVKSVSFLEVSGKRSAPSPLVLSKDFCCIALIHKDKFAPA